MRKLDKELFMEKVTILDSGCWFREGNIDRNGYVCAGTSDRAHRLAYRLWIEKPPPKSSKKHLHHTCENKWCCNPNDLILITVKEHKAEHDSRYANWTHCAAGHEYTIENTRVLGNGWKQCRECDNIRQKRYYHERKKRDKENINVKIEMLPINLASFL